MQTGIPFWRVLTGMGVREWRGVTMAEDIVIRRTCTLVTTGEFAGQGTRYLLGARAPSRLGLLVYISYQHHDNKRHVGGC